MRYTAGTLAVAVWMVCAGSAARAAHAQAAQAQASQAQTAPAALAGQAPGAPAGGQGGGMRGGPPIGVPTLGMPFVHDPSTVVKWKGRYYVYSTGRGIPFYSSPDLMTWTREGSVFDKIPDAVHAAVPKNDGTGVWAPDLVRVGGEFYLYYAVSSWGSFQSVVALAVNTTLDPKDPAYKWVDRGPVVSSDGQEDLNAIDPGVVLAPDGTLWICYGSYHGSIRITQLDPRTGLALKPKVLGEAIASARESEASDIIFHDGYYYLFVNHGSCCKGKDSEYNIRVGRSRTVAGPYLDKHGQALAKGAGSLFLSAHDHRIGPGHFGRVVDYDAPAGMESAPDGAERFSVHYEADTTRGGRSVLDVRPLLWSLDGWPVAGDHVEEGSYEIVGRQSENTLQERAAPVAKAGAGAGAAAGGVDASTAGAGSAGAVSTGDVRLGRYLALASQRWTVGRVAGGFCRILDGATGESLQAAVDGTMRLGTFMGADAQLWELEEFPDGGWRIRNKGTGGSLMESGGGMVRVGEFVRDDLHLWAIGTP